MPFKPMLQKPPPKKLYKTSWTPSTTPMSGPTPNSSLITLTTTQYSDIPAVYEPECGDGDAISVGDTGASAVTGDSIGASAAVVNLTGIGQPPRDGDGEAIGDASRDHSNTLAGDIMTGRIAYNRPFSGVIAGVPIPV